MIIEIIHWITIALAAVAPLLMYLLYLSNKRG